MLDLRLIRSQPDFVRAALQRRGDVPAAVDELLAADEAHRRLLVEQEGLSHRRNVVTQEISQIRRAGGDASAQITAMREVSDRIQALNGEIRELVARVEDLLLNLPN